MQGATEVRTRSGCRRRRLLAPLLTALILVPACSGAPDPQPGAQEAHPPAVPAPATEEPAGFASLSPGDHTVLPDGTERLSQPAEVRQRMGPVEIGVAYNRPSARGRDLFGGLLEWAEVWNPGANEATRIAVSHDVLVEGEPLPAGRYSLWAVPDPEEWTLVFSRAHDVFHTPYPEGHDALRLRIRPERGPHMETLAFYFPVAAQDSVRLHLHWGEVVVPLTLRTVEE
jgi:hypothetical protein